MYICITEKSAISTNLIFLLENLVIIYADPIGPVNYILTLKKITSLEFFWFFFNYLFASLFNFSLFLTKPFRKVVPARRTLSK